MVNKVILIGNVGADPEVRYLDGGIPVANLRLATSERYKNRNGENVEQTEWHNIVLWRGLAEVVEKYVKKGMRLYIEGRIRTRSWDDQNGVKRYTTEIYADNMQMLSRADGDAGTRSSGTYTQPAPPVPPAQPANPMPMDDPDDLPFWPRPGKKAKGKRKKAEK